MMLAPTDVPLDAQAVTALLSALAGAGVSGLIALLLLPQRRREIDAGSDSRIITASASIVEQAALTVPALMERITRLEGHVERARDEQAAERAELALWRDWAADAMAWMSSAVEAVRALGGSLGDPPAPPHRHAVVTTQAVDS